MPLGWHESASTAETEVYMLWCWIKMQGGEYGEPGLEVTD
jgi:hypothetical protein